MKRLVAIFADENTDEELEILFKDLEETSIEMVLSFDDGNKVIIEVPNEIPDPEYTGPVEEYWMNVMNDSRCPCCHPSEELENCGVYDVKTLEQFFVDSDKLNNGHGPYENLKSYLGR